MSDFYNLQDPGVEGRLETISGLPFEYRDLIADFDRENVAYWVGINELGEKVVDVADFGVVTNIFDAVEGYLVQFRPHETMRFLDPRIANFDENLSALTESLINETNVAWVENEQHKILSVVALTSQADSLVFPSETGEESLESMTLSEAQSIFALLAGASCVVGQAAAPCIAFLYPNDGCWARAHEMGRRIKAAGQQSGKIWTYKSLSVKTANTPRCRVGWRYHVASTVKVVDEGTLVIDPSLFNNLVAPEDWLEIQNGRRRDTAYTNSRVYYRSQKGSYSFDSNYSKTLRYLTQYRGKLLKRVRARGWPPYPC